MHCVRPRLASKEPCATRKEETIFDLLRYDLGPSKLVVKKVLLHCQQGNSRHVLEGVGRLTWCNQFSIKAPGFPEDENQQFRVLLVWLQRCRCRRMGGDSLTGEARWWRPSGHIWMIKIHKEMVTKVWGNVKKIDWNDCIRLYFPMTRGSLCSML